MGCGCGGACGGSMSKDMATTTISRWQPSVSRGGGIKGSVASPRRPATGAPIRQQRSRVGNVPLTRGASSSLGSPRVIPFANNQLMGVVLGGGDSVITTDPVPLRGSDRATVTFNVHYMLYPLGLPVFSYQGQVSNDGVNWVDVTALTETASGATDPVLMKVGTVNGAFLRFSITLSPSGSAGDISAVCFDLHVRLDHA